MASSTSFSAPRSQSKKPLAKMAGEWKQTPNSTVVQAMSEVYSILVGEVEGLPGPNAAGNAREAEDGGLLP